MRRIRAVAACAAIAVAAPAAAVEIDFALRGGDDDLESRIRNVTLLSVAEREGESDPQELIAEAQADYRRILAALYDAGHFGGVISILVDGREAAAIPPLSPPARIDRIQVIVTPGPTYLFDRARIDPLAPRTVLPEGFAVGQPAYADVIEEAAQTAVEAWRAEGHAKADVAEERIVARHAENRLSADIDLAPGPRLRFGEVTVAGNDRTTTRRILKIAGLEPGRVYDPDEIARAERRLRRSGVFRSVVVDEAETPVNGSLPLVIRVAEQTPRRFGFGAEYSSIDGATLSAFWLHRNLLGGAERVRVEGEVAGLGGETGGVDYTLGARYERPATPRTDTDLFAEIALAKLDEPDFESDTAEVTLGFTRYATEELIVSYGIGYLFSRVTDDSGTETQQLLTLPLSAQLDRRDDSLDPTRGYFADVDLTPFYGIEGSGSGAQLKADTRAYRSFGAEDRFTLAGRLQLGVLAGPGLRNTPTVYRFRSGGGGTVRGQDYRSLGVTVDGVETGGRSFLGLSGEVRAQVRENIEAVGFVDYGYVGRETFPDFSGDSHSGIGLGVRYQTALGPIRLDVATPLHGDTEASSYYLYLGIGQAF